MSEHAWWQKSVVYQVYPRSFQDANGDGVGDLEGIRRRLPYLAELGVDAVWISPFYRSPMADFGYDVSDYCDVDPLFGTLADFDRMVAEAHRLGLKIICDFVPNHTSESHPWFVESRSSRDNSKRDWYIWRDPAPDGGPPNNWLSNFGGPGWTFDEHTGQYYYHAFLTQQPDLDWRNPEVRAAMHDVLRFWLNRGVDGFRVDVIWHLGKDEAFRDNPINPDWTPDQPGIKRHRQIHSCDRPHVHDIVAGMRQVLEPYGDRVLIGEIYLPVERLVGYYGQDGAGAHLPFNFHLISTPWQADAIADLIRRYEAALPPGAWPNWVLSNHDKPRLATRIGADQARLAAMLLLTLRGTPTLYYGDELGFEDVPIPPERVQDPWGVNEPAFNRDPCRTPMAWDGSAHAGFSAAEPWLPLHADWPARNVAGQSAEPGSMLNLYKRLLALRRAEPALSIGAIENVAADGDLLRYDRVHGDTRLRVLLNFGAAEAPCPDGERLLATHDGLSLPPGGGVILKV